MPPSARRRARLNQAAALAAVTAAHGLVFALIGLNVPEVRRVFVEDRLPPMVVDLLRPPPPPRTVRRPSPPGADVSRPAPVRPRQVAIQAPPAPIAALPMAPPARAVPLPPGPRGDLRQALRRAAPGCANAEAVGLTRREREACDERLGRGAADAAGIPDPIDRAKREDWDAVAARKAVSRRRKEGAVPPGIAPGDNAGGTRTDGIGIRDY